MPGGVILHFQCFQRFLCCGCRDHGGQRRKSHGHGVACQTAQGQQKNQEQGQKTTHGRNDNRGRAKFLQQGSNIKNNSCLSLIDGLKKLFSLLFLKRGEQH